MIMRETSHNAVGLNVDFRLSLHVIRVRSSRQCGDGNVSWEVDDHIHNARESDLAVQVECDCRKVYLYRDRLYVLSGYSGMMVRYMDRNGDSCPYVPLRLTGEPS